MPAARLCNPDIESTALSVAIALSTLPSASRGPPTLAPPPKKPWSPHCPVDRHEQVRWLLGSLQSGLVHRCSRPMHRRLRRAELVQPAGDAVMMRQHPIWLPATTPCCSLAPQSHNTAMMKAASFSPALAAAAAPAPPRVASRSAGGGARLVARASSAALDSTLASGHWSGGSPLIMPNGTVGDCAALWRAACCAAPPCTAPLPSHRLNAPRLLVPTHPPAPLPGPSCPPAGDPQRHPGAAGGDCHPAAHVCRAHPAPHHPCGRAVAAHRLPARLLRRQ